MVGAIAIGSFSTLSGSDSPSPEINSPTTQETPIPVTQEPPIEVKVKSPAKTSSPEPKSPIIQENTVKVETKSITSTKSEEPELKCHPSYSGCLNPNASDYDCTGGSGNGPYYTGKVQVIGPDVFRLDGDRDGWGCETLP